MFYGKAKVQLRQRDAGTRRHLMQRVHNPFRFLYAYGFAHGFTHQNYVNIYLNLLVTHAIYTHTHTLQQRDMHG